MKLYGLKNCDTCRKALKALPKAELLDVRVDGVPSATLEKAFDQFGAALLNTRSTTWRGIEEAERARPALELIAEHPALMKRPLIDVDGTLYLGWTKEVQAALVG
ncbi:ArsC/Spx/MgsR family protein [Planktotalea sp.]|uniref:ArsC/Spx/MgsR family protein n=1 Tax=Planktotalea sp. TaxID=2029877 RepID=UPI003297F7F2